MAEEIKEITSKEEETQPTETAQNVPEQPKVKTYSEQEYNALKMQLESLEKSTKDNEDFKKKFEQSEKDRKEFEYQTHLNSYVKSLGLVDDIYEKELASLLKNGGAKFEKDKIIGTDETLKTFKEKYPQAFKNNTIPRFVDNTQGKASSVAEDTLRKIMGLKPKN